MALVFQGRIFFFEWTVVIKWEDVVRVLKQETGVRIEVSSPNKATYDFEQMFNPDKVYSSLVSLHNDTIIGAPSSKRTPRSISRGLRRGNSDPLQLSQIFNFDEPPVVYEGHVRDNYSSSIKKYSRTVSDPSLEPVQGQDEASNILTPTSLKNKWSEVIEDLVSYSETSIEVSSDVQAR